MPYGIHTYFGASFYPYKEITMKEFDCNNYEVIDLEEIEEISVPLHCNNLSSGE